MQMQTAAAPAALFLVIAFATGVSTLFLITGHAILRLTDLAEYREYSIRSSMLVGAVGGAIIFPIILIIRLIAKDYLSVRHPEGDRQRTLGYWITSLMLSLSITTIHGAAAGGIESNLLLTYGFNVIDPVHAPRAGALGGFVLGPGVIILALM